MSTEENRVAEQTIGSDSRTIVIVIQGEASGDGADQALTLRAMMKIPITRTNVQLFAPTWSIAR